MKKAFRMTSHVALDKFDDHQHLHVICAALAIVMLRSRLPEPDSTPNPPEMSIALKQAGGLSDEESVLLHHILLEVESLAQAIRHELDLTV